MELIDEVINKVRVYLRKNDFEKARKDKEERIKNILDLIKKDKCPKDQIKTLEAVKERYSLYLADYQKKSVDSLETLKNKVTTDLEVIESYFGAK